MKAFAICLFMAMACTRIVTVNVPQCPKPPDVPVMESEGQMDKRDQKLLDKFRVNWQLYLLIIEVEALKER